MRRVHLADSLRHGCLQRLVHVFRPLLQQHQVQTQFSLERLVRRMAQPAPISTLREVLHLFVRHMVLQQLSPQSRLPWLEQLQEQLQFNMGGLVHQMAQPAPINTQRELPHLFARHMVLQWLQGLRRHQLREV
jgi:hypothetical protein